MQSAQGDQEGPPSAEEHRRDETRDGRKRRHDRSEDSRLPPPERDHPHGRLRQLIVQLEHLSSRGLNDKAFEVGILFLELLVYLCQVFVVLGLTKSFIIQV